MARHLALDSRSRGGRRALRLSDPGRRAALSGYPRKAAALPAGNRLSDRLVHPLPAHGGQRRPHRPRRALHRPRKGPRAFFAQLAFNFFWSILFFNLQNYALALGWLVVLFALILWMIPAFAGADRTAALLQLPCLLWVAFAGYLNLGVLLLN